MLRAQNNHSSKFLKPVINTFGTTFLKELNNLTSFAVGYPTSHSVLKFGIGDTFYFRAKQYNTGCLLFVLFDINGPYNQKGFYVDVNKGKDKFKDFLLFVRNSSWYQDDYWYSKGQHCVVFNLQKLEHSYKMFLQSKFSEMYTKEQLKQMGVEAEFVYKGKKVPNYIHAILTKNRADLCNKYLARQIYEYFGTNVVPDNPDEFDISWFPQEEIFNYEYMNDEEKQLVNKMKTNDFNSKTTNGSKSKVF